MNPRQIEPPVISGGQWVIIPDMFFALFFISSAQSDLFGWFFPTRVLNFLLNISVKVQALIEKKLMSDKLMKPAL